MKVAFLSLGCKVNQAEIASMEGAARSKGHEVVSLEDSPELCIINTCTVTAKSDYQSRQLIRRAHRAGAEVLVTGCYSELNKDSVRAMPGVKEVIGNKEKLNYINSLIGNNESHFSNSNGRARYTLKVQDGCNSACSYCIIPKARGKSRSIPIEEAVLRVKNAVEKGYKEVILTGIHLGQYGHGGEGPISRLLEELLEKTDIARLRLSSLEVNEIDERLLGLFKNERLCRHLHVPLQSGDDSILRAMNRKYTTQYFIERITAVTKMYPGIALGTDVIAGFPWEGEKEFNNTYTVLESLPFTYIHVFPYSPRPGTLASEMTQKVSQAEKSGRCMRIRSLSERKRGGYMKSHISQTLDVLIEERVSDMLYRGTSSNYLKVEVTGEDCQPGRLVRVRVRAMKDNSLLGIHEKPS